ncbi:MAG: dehydrogenase, partial [Planctomycetota bacterium]|nr:dehydrogenase [Planctomycetota bacterium]
MAKFSFLNIAFTIVYWLSDCGLLLESAVANETGSYQRKINEIDFQIATGLELQLAAAPPLIKWPIVADWDIDGRLVVAESGGVQRPVAKHNLLGLHKIVRLIDEDNDGVFDQRMVAAEGLGFPEGVLCLGKSILVSIPPEIIKLTDHDGDGFCEEKETWFDGQTITGCANDLHGPYFGRDGKIYWCKGAFAEQHHLLADGQKLSSSAAHLYRCNEDGTQLEIVMTGGMDNPVEVALIPEGEKFFTSTFLQHPSEGRRDGIAHAIYGGLFGKEHDVLQGHPRTGDLMPIMTHLGPAAPSGLIYLEKDELFKSGSDDRSHRLCAALFNLHKVTLHRLRSSQSTYTTVDSDLIATDQVDFHPTD